MKPRAFLLTLLIFVIATTNLFAQSGDATTTASNRNWWGYCAELPSNPDDIGLLGMEQPDTYDACIRLTTSQAVLNGATLHGLAFLLPSTEHIENVKVWLSKELPATADMADVLVQSVPAEALHAMDQGYIQVMFNTDYALDADLYAGYSFTVTQAETDGENYPLCCYGGTTKANAFFFKAQKSLNTWQDVAGRQYGDLLMQVLVSNPTMPQNKAQLVGAAGVVLVAEEEGQVPVYLTNQGLLGISSIGYQWTVDGTALPAETYVLPQRFNTLGGTTALQLPFTPAADFRQHDLQLRLTQVNDADNEAGPQTASARITTVAQASPRRILVEEFTGTWCGWCPRGMVAMDWLHENMPHETVLIAVHSGDLMAIAQTATSYSSVLASVSDLPYAYLNRVLGCDPYHGTDASALVYNDIHINQDIKAMLALHTEAAINVAPRWNADSTAITATTEVTFQYNRQDAPYALAYVLVADDLHGNTSSWNQENYYSRYASQASYFAGTPLYSVVRGGSRMSGVHYNHVAMAAWGVKQGLDGSISAPLVAGQTQVYNFQAQLPSIDASLLQDRSKLQLAVLLINRESGEVINAAISPFGTSSDAASVQLPMQACEDATAVYDLQGRQQQGLRRGLNVVRMSNGETRKVYIR